MAEIKNCQYLIKLGFLAYLDNTTDFREGVGESQGWWEGFAAGLQEAGVISDIVFQELIEGISKRGV